MCYVFTLHKLISKPSTDCSKPMENVTSESPTHSVGSSLASQDKRDALGKSYPAHRIRSAQVDIAVGFCSTWPFGSSTILMVTCKALPQFASAHARTSFLPDAWHYPGGATCQEDIGSLCLMA
jgi:hypothetical protein